MHVFGGSIMRRYQAFIAGLLLQVAAIRPSEATRVFIRTSWENYCREVVAFPRINLSTRCYRVLLVLLQLWYCQ
ncbi:hypothetical protein F4819DRAFT_443696 [Hypoxylon fuscum]|nr:hypothetical protein F4819DRAFT_443696 [Hypoxylon fuscum]